MTELNTLNLTINEAPLLSPLFKDVLNKKNGPKQSDILKVNIIYYFD